MIVDMESNKKLSPIVTALLSIEKVNISLDFNDNLISKCLKL